MIHSVLSFSINNTIQINQPGTIELIVCDIIVYDILFLELILI